MGNLIPIILPILIQLVESLMRGKKKGKVKKQTVIDLMMVAISAGQVKLPDGLTTDLIKPLLSMLIDMAVRIYNDSGVFKK